MCIIKFIDNRYNNKYIIAYDDSTRVCHIIMQSNNENNHDEKLAVISDQPNYYHIKYHHLAGPFTSPNMPDIIQGKYRERVLISFPNNGPVKLLAFDIKPYMNVHGSTLHLYLSKTTIDEILKNKTISNSINVANKYDIIFGNINDVKKNDLFDSIK